MVKFRFRFLILGHSLLHEEHWFWSRNRRNRGLFPDVLASDSEPQNHGGLGVVWHQRPRHQLQVTRGDLFSVFRIHFDSIRIPLRKQFEIIVTLEGITPETGNTVQVSVRSNIRNDPQYCQQPLFMTFIKGALSIVNIDAWLALGADILCSQRDTLGISLWEFVCYLR